MLGGRANPGGKKEIVNGYDHASLHFYAVSLFDLFVKTL
jgi:hypothetical protein